MKECNIHDYKYSKIAIDSSILIYKYRYASKDSEDSHIHGFIQKACFYLKRGILPVFVFDGTPPGAKKGTLDKRCSQKSKIEKRIQALVQKRELSTVTDTSDIENEIAKLGKQVTYVTKTHRRECKYILKLLGIPFVEANGEAETTCAELQKRGIVDYTFTEDTDALTFGAPKVLKCAKKLERVIEIDLSVILDKMELTMDSFIDFCILCGCDYCPTIPKIGPVTALSLIKKHGSIETILGGLDPKYTIPDNFDYETARMLFKHDPIKDDIYDISIKDIQYDGLTKFITDEKGLSEQVLENIIRRYKKSIADYNKVMVGNKATSQPSILSFFNPNPNPNQTLKT